MFKTAVGVLAMAAAATAQSCSQYDDGETQFWWIRGAASTDPTLSTLLFSLVMTSFVMLSFAGFMWLHAGQSGSTSVVSDLFKAAVVFGTTLATWWTFGYAFAYGNSYQAQEDPDSPTKSYQWFIGDGGYFLQNINPCEYFIFIQQFAFAAFAAAIFAGAVAGRTKLSAYIISTVWFVMWIYPTTLHWTNSRTAWLVQGAQETLNAGIGYYDYAGAGFIHCVGGTAALVGAMMVGKRTEVPKPHSTPLIAIGTSFVLLGMVGINCGSVVAPHANYGLMAFDQQTGVTAFLALINTFLSAGGAAFAVLVLQVVKKVEFWSFPQIANGMIAGAVSVSAGCNTVYPWAAFVIGMVGGLVYVTWSGIVSKAGIDDASDSFAVHFGAGAWSLMAVTMFAMDKQKSLGQYLIFTNDHAGSLAGKRIGGIFYDADDRESWVRLGWNFFAIFMIFLWVAVNLAVVLVVLKTMGQLRVDDSTVAGAGGLDQMSHGTDAYVSSAAPAAAAKPTTSETVEEGEAGPVEVKTSQI